MMAMAAVVTTTGNEGTMAGPARHSPAFPCHGEHRGRTLIGGMSVGEGSRGRWKHPRAPTSATTMTVCPKMFRGQGSSLCPQAVHQRNGSNCCAPRQWAEPYGSGRNHRHRERRQRGVCLGHPRAWTCVQPREGARVGHRWPPRTHGLTRLILRMGPFGRVQGRSLQPILTTQFNLEGQRR